MRIQFDGSRTRFGRTSGEDERRQTADTGQRAIVRAQLIVSTVESVRVLELRACRTLSDRISERQVQAVERGDVGQLAVVESGPVRYGSEWRSNTERQSTDAKQSDFGWQQRTERRWAIESRIER